ncbi:hypothetical protein AWM69_03140 [Pseudomonas sp. D1HM]|nr:hypothetical protein [Pseudomonas sp. D1HM]
MLTHWHALDIKKVSCQQSSIRASRAQQPVNRRLSEPGCHVLQLFAGALLVEQHVKPVKGLSPLYGVIGKMSLYPRSALYVPPN